jgi:hypothetical protein
MLASLNMEARSQLLSLKKPTNFGLLSLNSDFDYFNGEKTRKTRVENWV